ncbi:uncharacterized protein C8orf88 homolog isoform X2 [Betta splendens]|nr:uncharacterized protein C8orf88 homolog isoform X2 [Betta splendens]XP_028986405.1 uncharacterized protein C8orf88 homolog isoform X2 [Betta splendens]
MTTGHYSLTNVKVLPTEDGEFNQNPSLNVTDARMEVSRRRIPTKHLEPARPLRRCMHMDAEPAVNAALAKALREDEDQVTVGIEQFLKIVNMTRQKQGRISYTRDVLIGLANCPASREKPKFLPDHPVVLTEARDPGHLWLHELMSNCGKEEG